MIIEIEFDFKNTEDRAMKKYIAIGHFAGEENMTSVAMSNHNMKDFRADCGGNGFIPWVIITEKRMETMKSLDCFDLFNEVKKMTTNYRRWDDITEYIEQCFDIMEEKMARA